MICYKGGYEKHKGGMTIVSAVFDKFLAVAANFSIKSFCFLREVVRYFDLYMRHTCPFFLFLDEIISFRRYLL